MTTPGAFICFSGIAPTVGDTAIGQSILQALKARASLPIHVHSNRPEVFELLPEIGEIDTVRNKLPTLTSRLRGPLLPVKVARLVKDLRSTGGARRLPARRYEALRETLQGCVAVVYQGGPNWNDRWVTPQFALERWCFAEAAHYYGALVFHVGVSCGPFTWPLPGRLWTTQLVRQALNQHDGLWVRDRFSRTALARLGVTSPIVESTDAAVFLTSSSDPRYTHLEQPPRSQGRPRVVCCVRDYQALYPHAVAARDHVYQTLARLMDYVQSTLADVFFLGTDHLAHPSKRTDFQVAQHVVQLMRQPGAVVLNEDVANAAALKQVYGTFDAMISMRLHPTILALGEGVPCLVVSYDDKCRDFFGALELEEYSFGLQEFQYEACVAVVTKMLQTAGLKDTIRKRFASHKAKHAHDWDPLFARIAARVDLRSRIVSQ